MRVVSTELDAEVSGTTHGDRLEVHAWRGDEVVAPNLLVTSWSLGWDGGRQVQGQGTFTFADPDGRLAPWSLGDALGPGGSRLQVSYVFGQSGTRVPLGWWRIRHADPVETWRAYRAGYIPSSGIWPGPDLFPSSETFPEAVAPRQDGVVLRVSGGGSVTVQADEETSTVVLDRLDAEVVTASTCLGEVRRLLADICPVVVDDAVVDRDVPGSLVYGDSRMDAVEDLLSAVRATYRMGPDGAFQVVPVAGVGPVWTLAGGDEGVLVRLARTLSDEGVYNGAISSGETPEGAPLIGRDYISGGPLVWGGPFGRVPVFHRSIAATPTGVQADAETLLASRVRSGEVDLAVTCLAHPGIQIHDRVGVIASTRAGESALEGRVVAMSLRSATSDAGTTPAKQMNLTVRVSADALEAIASRVRRA